MSKLEHEFRMDREDCIWCGSTPAQIEDFGERWCPRRETTRSLLDYSSCESSSEARTE